MVVLIAVSSGDVASYHQAECLLAMGDWEDLPDVEQQRACARYQVRMWWLPDGCFERGPSGFAVATSHRRGRG